MSGAVHCSHIFGTYSFSIAYQINVLCSSSSPITILGDYVVQCTVADSRKNGGKFELEKTGCRPDTLHCDDIYDFLAIGNYVLAMSYVCMLAGCTFLIRCLEAVSTLALFMCNLDGQAFCG